MLRSDLVLEEVALGSCPHQPSAHKVPVHLTVDHIRLLDIAAELAPAELPARRASSSRLPLLLILHRQKVDVLDLGASHGRTTSEQWRPLAVLLVFVFDIICAVLG